ncbi:MAG: hypothetical protein U0936_05420 [Planctomycetaceae bacterium]
MADEKPKSATGPKVSPARTVASLILLLIVGVVCAIELRAGFGQRMSGNSLAANSNDGEFKDLSLEAARGMMALSPSETSENRGPDTYYHFEWYSLLRPLMGQANPKLTIVATNEEKPMALAFFAADETDSPARPAQQTGVPTESGAGPGGHGMMSGGMGGPGMGMGGGPGGGGKKNKRPPMEDEPASTDSPPPAETPAPSENSTPSETPVGDMPATEEPAPAK